MILSLKFQFCLKTFVDVTTLEIWDSYYKTFYYGYLYIFYNKPGCLSLSPISSFQPQFANVRAGNTKGGSITVPLTSCLTGLELAVWQLTFFVFYLQNRLIQTSQTGGQWYSDTSPFSIPRLELVEVADSDKHTSLPY